MSYIQSSFLSIACLLLFLLTIQAWMKLLVSGQEHWLSQYQAQICARLELLQSNLDTSLSYLSAWDRESDRLKNWQAQAESMLRLWQGYYSQQMPNECPTHYQLYQQKGVPVPEGYPNWWVRWLDR